MRKLLTAALLSGAIGFVHADEPKKPIEAKPATKIDDKKADEKKADDKKPETPKEKFAAIKASLNKEMRAWSAEYQKADPEARGKLMKSRMEILQGHGKQAFDLARNDYKDDVSLDALTMAMQYGSEKLQTEAGDALVANFADNDKLADMLPMLANGEHADKLLNALAEKSTKKEIKGGARYALVEQMIESADYPRTGKAAPAKESAEKLAAAKAKLTAIVTEFGDVTVAAGRGKTTIKKAAEKQNYFLDNLVVGKVLPDVESELLDGKKTKISDYRGKVVVLDIWATWCGPCRAMIPHERELTAKLKDKPFAFISVSADDKKETLEKFLEKEEMPWTHWWDGRGGKLTEQYQVRFFPTVYVLDGKGVIRFKHVRGDDMDKSIETLLKETDSKKGE